MIFQTLFVEDCFIKSNKGVEMQNYMPKTIKGGRNTMCVYLLILNE